MASIAFFARSMAPDAPVIFDLCLSGLAGLAVVALALTLENEALPKLTQGALAGGGLALIGALLGTQEARLRLFSLVTAALMAGFGLWLARGATRKPSSGLLGHLLPHRPSRDGCSSERPDAGEGRAPLSSPGLARGSGERGWGEKGVQLYVASLAALYGAYIVLASRDLMIADFMTYRGISIMVARLANAGNWPLLMIAAVESIAQDYSWFPALAPGLALALTAPFSRAVYTFAPLALYAAPAAIALAILSRDLARRAMPSPLPTPGQAPGLRLSCERESGLMAFGVAAVVVAYPAGMAVAARGMPDVGGLVLVVIALRLAERLARLLALPKGHDACLAPMTRRVGLALALTMFAMFAFRRWYAFAAFGVAVMLALEVGLVALRRGRDFRWREAIAAGALGALTLLALASPLIVDWLPNLSAHDYASAYAAYRKPRGVFLRLLADWVGLLPALAALGGAALLWARSSDRRLLRLTLGGAAMGALLFLRIQTPYVHHLYLIAPAIAAPLAATLMVAFTKAPRPALAALAGLAALTLSPLAAALNPFGLTPTAGLPRPRRADLDELERLKNWVDARARSDAKVCGLGSSYTFSGQLIGELWQLHPERQALGRKAKTDVMMSDVDTVEGPPVAGLKDCAIVIVGDPVQTHLNPDYQQTVIVPSREMLTGQGIGAKFRRTGEVFHLERGVTAVVFERVAPLDDADIAALQARWRAARASLGFEGAVRM
jgi:hypothetical protein